MGLDKVSTELHSTHDMLLLVLNLRALVRGGIKCPHGYGQITIILDTIEKC